MMKAMIAVSIAAAALALAGCAADGQTGRNLNGFPIDEKCADFHAQSPIYHGNRALAYAQNCVSPDH